jgi:hypothetical protein
MVQLAGFSTPALSSRSAVAWLSGALHVAQDLTLLRSARGRARSEAKLAGCLCNQRRHRKSERRGRRVAVVANVPTSLALPKPSRRSARLTISTVYQIRTGWCLVNRGEAGHEGTNTPSGYDAYAVTPATGTEIGVIPARMPSPETRTTWPIAPRITRRSPPHSPKR